MLEKESFDNITELLNQTGAPFQDWCAEKVKEAHSYLVLTEYPYTWPKQNGSIIGTPGSIDIIAAHFDDGTGRAVLRNSVLYLIIECKRANSEIKNWIFPKVTERFKEPSCFLSQERRNEKDLLNQIKNNITFPQLDYPTQEEFEACVQGYEINETLKNLNQNKTQIIYRYLTQANTGLAALSNRNRFEIPNFDLPPHDKALFLPVVVTTANLYLANYNPNDVDIPSGEIDCNKINYESKKWLTFQYPLPDYLGYNNLEKMPTFIVNAEHWVEFLKRVHIVYGMSV